MRFGTQFIVVLSLSTSAWSRYLLRRDDFKILSDLQANMDDITSLEGELNKISSPNTDSTSSSSSRNTASSSDSIIDITTSKRQIINTLRSLTTDLNKTISDISAATPITDTNASQMLTYLTTKIKPQLLEHICPLLKTKASFLEEIGLQSKIRQALFVETSSALDRMCVSLKIKVPTSRVSAVVNLQRSFVSDFGSACDPWINDVGNGLVKQDL